MYCVNCQAEVKPVNGYCELCGTPLNARLCPNGHIMDPTWTECQYCPPGARQRQGQGGTGDRDRTLLETGGPPPLPPGGFTKGATLLEGQTSGSSKGRTVIEPSSSSASMRGQTIPESGLPGFGDKKKTVFDAGAAHGAEGGMGGPAVGQARLVGWLVTYSHDPAGIDFRLREGRNTIGKDREECEVHIAWDETVSTKHAVIMVRDGKFLIRDNDSTNGTIVNGEDIFGKGAVVLQGHDQIKIGESTFVLYTI
jgi:hypothetical protein